MAKKNSKDEWRRKKKLREREAARATSGEEAIATADEVKARFLDLRRRLSVPEQAELDNIMDEKMGELEAGELEGPPFRLDFGRMADEARARVQAQRMAQVRSERQFKGEKRGSQEEQSVDSYLQFLSFALWTSREERRPERQGIVMRTYVAMQNARVFHIGHETYAAVHQEADRYTTELAGLDYQPYSGPRGRHVPEKESRTFVATFMKEARHQVYPDKLPFPSIFLGYGPGIVLPAHTMDLKAPSQLRDDIEELVLLGHLMTDDGLALSCFLGRVRRDGQASQAIWFDEARTPETGWTRSPGLDLEPWTLPHMVRIINDHRTFVVETELTGALRRDVRHNKKQLGLDDYKQMPKPYYVLRLQTHVVQEKVRKQLGRPIQPRRYKTDVRGHERCRIRRGALPIEPKLADKLQKRGYKLFTTNQLDEETYQRLHERGFAYKRSDEWLAVKASWVKDHMSSADPKLPYVPAVRKLGNVRVRPRKVTSGFEDPAAR